MSTRPPSPSKNCPTACATARCCCWRWRSGRRRRWALPFIGTTGAARLPGGESSSQPMETALWHRPSSAEPFDWVAIAKGIGRNQENDETCEKRWRDALQGQLADRSTLESKLRDRLFVCCCLVG